MSETIPMIEDRPWLFLFSLCIALSWPRPCFQGTWYSRSLHRLLADYGQAPGLTMMLLSSPWTTACQLNPRIVSTGSSPDLSGEFESFQFFSPLFGKENKVVQVVVCCRMLLCRRKFKVLLCLRHAGLLALFVVARFLALFVVAYVR